MFWKKQSNESKPVSQANAESELSIEALKKALVQMDDAEFVEINISENQNVDLIYVRTLIDQERLNESIVKPLYNCSKQSIQECNVHSSIN
ncbi:spore germination protein [Psychrobacillus antarcticus]|uniref:spore germination protein n=1 Tax=Psychrobacillus antarcticus TaxID=2879115 RepID=UPI002407B22B|nr:spore germination protein [Psychrobacillus antarcticus]